MFLAATLLFAILSDPECEYSYYRIGVYMRTFTAIGCILTGTVWAGLKTLPVAAGDCRNAELLTGMGSFESALKAQLGADWMSGDVALDVARPKATRSLEDIQRQIDSARTLFYGDQMDKALSVIHQAQTELERVSPLMKPWPVRVDAAMLEALIYKSQDKKAEFNDAVRKVLRVDNTFQPDTNFFTPGFLQEVEKLRKEGARTKKPRLDIRSTSPADVYIDGRLMGKTPYKIDLLPSQYRVMLVQQESQSFARTIDFKKDEALMVDMAFEGLVSNQTPLCLSVNAEKEQVSTALKLGASVGVEQVVLFRLTSLNQDPPYFRATLLTKGIDVRSGGVQMKDKSATNLLKDLATYVLTGVPGKSVETGDAIGKRVDANAKTTDSKATSPAVAKTPPPPAVKPVAPPVPAPPKVDSPPSIADTKRETSELAVSTQGPTNTPRIVSFVLMGAGVAAGAGAAITYVSGGKNRTELAGYLGDKTNTLLDSEDANFGVAAEKAVAVRTNRQLTYLLAGAGAALLASGALTYFLFPEHSGTEVALVPSSNGAHFVLTGRF
jgi:PEGA domain